MNDPYPYLTLEDFYHQIIEPSAAKGNVMAIAILKTRDLIKSGEITPDKIHELAKEAVPITIDLCYYCRGSTRHLALRSSAQGSCKECKGTGKTMTDPSLHRTNINLYLDDVEWLRARYGFGWTERVREIVHAHIHRVQNPEIFAEEPETDE